MSVQAAGPSATTTSIYRYYDRHGILIYVGITARGMARNEQHNIRAEWWPYVTRQEVEHGYDRADARTREKSLIEAYRPPFNRQHNPGYAELRAAYLSMTAADQHESAMDIYRRVARRLPIRPMPREPSAWHTAIGDGALAVRVEPPTRTPVWIDGRQHAHFVSHEILGRTLILRVKPLRVPATAGYVRLTCVSQKHEVFTVDRLQFTRLKGGFT